MNMMHSTTTDQTNDENTKFSTTTFFRKKNILVVDDEPHMALAIEFLLNSSEYQIYSAENRDDAISQIEKIVPDLILLDILMPESPKDGGFKLPDAGYDVYKNLKSKKNTKKIPIIILSVKSGTVNSDRHNIKADRFFSKPFKNDELLDSIKELTN